VGIDNNTVLPAYFTSLAAVAEPQEYAARVKAVIQAQVSYDKETFYKAARKAADSSQRRALES
jgi:hypothetical protein